jgi:hypothetical protein
VFWLAKAWAQSSPQPVLTITPAVSNQFIVTITNGLSTANYDLYWIPALAAADPNNPALGALAVFIDSPTNGSNLTQ